MHFCRQLLRAHRGPNAPIFHKQLFTSTSFSKLLLTNRLTFMPVLLTHTTALNLCRPACQNLRRRNIILSTGPICFICAFENQVPKIISS